jgi:CBS domain-containing protein
MRICDLMHRGVIFCYPEDSVTDVIRTMDHNQIRSAVVVDESGEVWGLISIMELLPLYGRNLDAVRAEDIMRPYKVDIDAQAPLEQAVEIMKRRRIEHLIVIDPHAGPRRPIGILTTYDIIQHMSGLKFGHFEYRLTMSQNDKPKKG